MCAVNEGGSSSLSQLRGELVAAVPPQVREWCDVDVAVTQGTPGREIVHDAHPLPWPPVRLVQESAVLAGMNRSRA